MSVKGKKGQVEEVPVLKRKDIEDRTWEEQQQAVLAELRKIYREVVEPLENEYAYDQFRPSYFADVLTATTPLVLFIGPFSSGKTTFINYLLGGDYLFTGPEPTTNKYTTVFYGQETNQLSGRILASNPSLPYKGLQQFGNDFLESFSGLQVNSDILRSVTLVDSPGVLETSDSHSRSFDYVGAMRWFVEHADLIFVMFDPTKLDAGRELRTVFQTCLKGHESRIRIVLNKADSVGQHELMKVHGALFWNLSNLVSTSEPPRVFVSSFWANPYRPNTNHQLFETEKQALLYDMLYAIPMESIDRKVTALLKRAQDVLIHAAIIGTARQKLPKYFGKRAAKIETIDNIDQVYAEVQAKYRLPAANFPNEDEYKKFFTKLDLYDFKKLKNFEENGTIERLQKSMNYQIPGLLKSFTSEAGMDPRKSNMLQKMLERQRKEAEANNRAEVQPPPSYLFAPPVTQYGGQQYIPQPYGQQQPPPPQQQPIDPSQAGAYAPYNYYPQPIYQPPAAPTANPPQTQAPSENENRRPSNS